MNRLNENKEITPKVYFVTYDKAFLYALHCVELIPGIKIHYFDKRSGLIEALSKDNDVLTIRVTSLSQKTTKIVAYVDSNNKFINSAGRYRQLIKNYYEQLNGHLVGFNENS